MKLKLPLRSSELHILAMGLMLLDHMWGTLFPRAAWLTCVGRIAYPIFAFMLVEGFFHTHDLKNYMKRMLIAALISEIPFNLMMGASIFGLTHQNVLWTFLIALLLMAWIENTKKKGKLWLTVVVSAAAVLIGFVGGTVTMVDYYGPGVVTVLIFYFFHGKKWWCLLGQFACLYWLNVELLGGLYYPVTIFGMYFEVVQQGLALLALIPIWLYNGEKGCRAKWFQITCYAFYPAHMLVLAIIMMLRAA